MGPLYSTRTIQPMSITTLALECKPQGLKASHTTPRRPFFFAFPAYTLCPSHVSCKPTTYPTAFKLESGIFHVPCACTVTYGLQRRDKAKCAGDRATHGGRSQISHFLMHTRRRLLQCVRMCAVHTSNLQIRTVSERRPADAAR